MKDRRRPAAPRSDTPWWRTAVIYQIHIRSFADADGDGIGDIAGIRERLPCLRDLGVDAENQVRALPDFDGVWRRVIRGLRQAGY